MKKVVFFVAALFVNSSSVIGIRQRAAGIGLGLENETSYYVHVSFNLNNYDVRLNGQRNVEPMILGAHDLDRFIGLEPKAEVIENLPDEIFFSVSRRRHLFWRETFNFKLILKTSQDGHGYNLSLRGRGLYNADQLFEGTFHARCFKRELEGHPHYFAVNISQCNTLDGLIRDKCSEHCSCI